MGAGALLKWIEMTDIFEKTYLKVKRLATELTPVWGEVKIKCQSHRYIKLWRYWDRNELMKNFHRRRSIRLVCQERNITTIIQCNYKILQRHKCCVYEIWQTEKIICHNRYVSIIHAVLDVIFVCSITRILGRIKLVSFYRKCGFSTDVRIELCLSKPFDLKWQR